MISGEKFLAQLLKVLLKIAVIYWFYIYQGRIVIFLLNFHSTKSNSIALIISCSFAALITGWYIKKEEGRNTLFLRGIHWKIWIGSLLLCIAPLLALGGGPGLIAKDKITTEFVLYTFTIVFCVPVVEEIVFRGLLQKHLSTKLPPWLAIVITSILFALAHYEIISRILPAFLIGIFCGFIYYRTDKLILCILYHALFNLLGAVLQFSIKYDPVRQILTLILAIGLVVYSIRGFMRGSSSYKNNV